MAKFGELIDLEVPVLLGFYTDWDEPSKAMQPVLRDVAAALGDRAKVIKIDVDKNNQLAEALRIKGLPTMVLYKDGEMKW
ncbi:MAG TPA: thioredoxin family protein, partial [Flavobacteriaceae bacterium]|nr:thioredoxin family protein [Flavobacteriaceae bacterium]